MKYLKEFGGFVLFGLLLFAFDGILPLLLPMAAGWVISLLSVALVSVLWYFVISVIIKK